MRANAPYQARTNEPSRRPDNPDRDDERRSPTRERFRRGDDERPSRNLPGDDPTPDWERTDDDGSSDDLTIQW